MPKPKSPAMFTRRTRRERMGLNPSEHTEAVRFMRVVRLHEPRYPALCWLFAIPNGGWRNASFQGYADHLDSDEFAEGMAQLLELAARRRTAIMCAEAVWWRCHRRLISDDFVARGWDVIHLMAPNRSEHHVLNVEGVMRGDVLQYPAPQTDLF